MKFPSIVILLFIQITNAQLKKSLEDFTVLKTFDGVEVVLIPSNENHVEISGVRSDEVETELKNGVLKIKMGIGKLVKGEHVKAKLYFKQIISIDANEGSYVVCDKILKQKNIELSAQEGAQIKLILQCNTTTIRAVTGSEVTVSGRSDSSDVTVFTGGIVSAKGLKTKSTVVSISAGGEVKVYATETIDAKTRAGGSITVYGNPSKVTKKTTLGGSIDIMN